MVWIMQVIEKVKIGSTFNVQFLKILKFVPMLEKKKKFNLFKLVNSVSGLTFQLIILPLGYLAVNLYL